MLKARKSLNMGQVSTRHRLNKGSPTESSDLLAVLDELDLDTLADSGVGLLGLNTDLLQDDTLGVGSTTEGRGLEGGSEETLLEVEIGPALLLAVRLELAGGVKTTGLSFTHLELFLSEAVENEG
jgi:hypothetical protein